MEMKALVPFGVLSSAANQTEHFRRFFSNLITGELFSYGFAYDLGEVKRMAAQHGVTVEGVNCGEAGGKFAVRVVSA